MAGWAHSANISPFSPNQAKSSPISPNPAQSSPNQNVATNPLRFVSQALPGSSHSPNGVGFPPLGTQICSQRSFQWCLSPLRGASKSKRSNKFATFGFPSPPIKARHQFRAPTSSGPNQLQHYLVHACRLCGPHSLIRIPHHFNWSLWSLVTFPGPCHGPWSLAWK